MGQFTWRKATPMEESQNIDEGRRPFSSCFHLNESEIINYHNAIGKRIYTVDEYSYILDEAGKPKKISISDDDIPQDTLEKLNKIINPDIIIQHDNYEILTTPHISVRILKIIEETEKYCFLVTPYFDNWTHLENCLKKAADQKKKIIFFIRDEKFYTKNIQEFYNEYKFDMIFVKDLHAKIFVNEREAIITSMNLYDYSQKNNHEIGVLIKNKDDVNKIAKDIIMSWVHENKEALFLEGNYYKSLINNEFFNETVIQETLVEETTIYETSVEDIVAEKTIVEEEIVEKTGFCICCKKIIKYNNYKPICDECNIGNKNGNNSVIYGKYCHKCGKNYSSKSGRPRCNECFYTVMSHVKN
jgi:hypothetical protein